MAWFRVQLTQSEQEVVRQEREHHPNRVVRQRMMALWLLHHGTTREKAAEILEVGRISVQRWVASYRDEGLDGLRRWEVKGPQSELTAYAEVIRASLEKEPVPTVAQARERIKQLTGLDRGLTQTRKFLKGLGFTWQRVRAVPVPPKKTLRSMSRNKRCFTTPS